MNSPAATPSLNPELLNGIIEQFLAEARPAWTTTALARLLNLIFPSVSTKKWLRLLKSREKMLEELCKAELPSLLGRMARVLAEMREEGTDGLPFLKHLPWIFTFNARTGDLTGGNGLEGAIALMMEEVLKQPAREQEAFFGSYLKAFKIPLVPRRQDTKALWSYAVLVINWREIEKCATIREAFQFFYSQVARPACPKGMDPIDFEEREIKWFDKLCNRNLGLRLKARGRPKKKIPQP